MRYFLLVILFSFSLSAFATHNRAGEITYRHISGLTYEFTITTYVYTLSQADRPTLTLQWGDNTQTVVPRISKINLPNNITKNTYIGNHTFLGNGVFTVSMEDPNRNGGVINIPNSISVAFYIETKIVINPFFHTNSSPILLSPPLDNGCVGYPFMHNPSAFDVDGDSLTYQLVPCKEQNGNDIYNYSYPATSGTFTIDPYTGTLLWDSPVQSGEYNVAILIREYRNGTLLGTVLRDMQILIAACNNNPPEVRAMNDTCVEVGENLKFEVYASDIDNDLISLTATGGPLIFAQQPATFPTPLVDYIEVSDTFRWTPICQHVRKQPYHVIFKAEDNGSPVHLIDIETRLITVVAPAPKNLSATAKGIDIHLIWNKSFCQNASHYDIYRHNGYINYIANNCETGVPAWTGYQKVGSTTDILDTTFIDDNNGYGLIQGIDYCYMVIAVFDDGAESYPSYEDCAFLLKDVPVITHVTIDSTDISMGELTTIWAKPTEFDTILAPGPYIYLIYHSDQANGQNMILIDSLTNLNDTIYKLDQQNTLQNDHYFKIVLVNNTPSNRFTIGPSQVASSIFLNATGLDNRVELSWSYLVPWQNDTIVIYRENATNQFDSIGYTLTNSYTDSNLLNGTAYCYKVKSIGRYTASGFVHPILNESQITCAQPEDNEPPCSPILYVKSDCDIGENTISWTNPNLSCADDVYAYALLYKESIASPYDTIYKTDNAQNTSFAHTNLNTIAGCYYIIAIDSFQNISPPSAEVCVDIVDCDPYRLPNIITPNGDGLNDLFQPFPYAFVDKVNMVIYNRWGIMVYKTENPNIDWDGKDINSQNPCSDGVYFYVCEVFERRLEGIVKRDIHGTVTIIGVDNK